MRVGVVYYPGSNCEQDAAWAARMVGMEADYVWHADEDVSGYDALVLAGGFAYGDYLRVGALARFSPVMRAVERFAADGGLVLGICNGFQVLVEAGMLPGALLPNDGLKFRCQDVLMRVDRTDTPYTNACRRGQVLRINMAHYEGNYVADEETLDELEANGQVVMRFSGPDGERSPAFNPNGSARDIAAVADRSGRVLGLMPHPERSMVEAMGSSDGRFVWESLRAAIAGEPAGDAPGSGPAEEAAAGNRRPVSMREA